MMAAPDDVDPESFSIPLGRPSPAAPSGDYDPERSSVPVVRKPILATSHERLPSAAGAGKEWNSDALGPVTSDVTDLRGAFGEGYRSVPQSVTNPGARSMFTPEAQTTIKQWPYGLGAVTNAVGDFAGTAAGAVAGVGNSALSLGDAALASVGVPPALRRDINVEATNAPFAPELRRPPELRPGIKPADAPTMRALTQPPTPSLPAVFQQQRALIPPDPATAAAIDLLRRSTGSANIPTPPVPFRGAAVPPAGGLLNVPSEPVAPSGAGLLGPRVAAADAPIMSAADIQARARGHFSAADQAAAQGSMLPDDNAAAVRKIFSDAIPSDPEQARIAATRPTVQAARNVDTSGAMSYDTAMMLDRDLTERLRGASGSDRHEVGQLQAKLRDQMDQVPELDSLAPGRQAYKQYIKQSQVEDINYGAGLKNDPAAADAYVRQRAAALLKNSNATRNWTPEETAALEQVARSGDIGMLGRLGVSFVKPVARAAGGGLGGLVGGVPGAFVGSEIGGDIGATQAAKLRAYLSKTTLDPVSRQISLGVPPPPGQ